MTYHYKYWSAFTEADLLNAGDHDLGTGDTFVMPGAATNTLAAYDNDGQLSGGGVDHDSQGYNQNTWVHNGHGWVDTSSSFYVAKTYTLHGSDGKVYTLAEIEGGYHDAAGEGDDYFSFVGATPPAGVTLTVGNASSSHGVNYSDLSADPSQPPANVAPVFNNLPANGVIHLDENNTDVIDVNASDADGDTLTYSITGGADAADFSIDAHTGELTFNTAPDFENPADGNGNNVYDVTVTVTDGNGGTTTKPLWVKVQDVDEAPAMECIEIEAEDFHLNGMTIQHGSQASGGDLVRTEHLGGQGDLTTTFNGQGGTYDLSIFAQDETDGQSSIMVNVNGVLVEAFKLDRQTDGGGSNNSGFTEFVIKDVSLSAGDEIKIVVDGDAGEWGRIDKIKLQQTSTEVVNPDLVCLDFNGLAAGDVVNTQFDGVMISAQRDGEGGSGSTSPNDAMIFDSSNPTGGDHDLETANQGNILIVSEDNDSHDPDDNAAGGTIWFKFDNPASVESIKVIDSEEGGKIRLLDENGVVIKDVIIPNGVDGGIQTVDINAEGVAQIDLTLNGSGAIDDLKYIPGEAPVLGSISGVVFMDNNDNSIEDAGDMRVEGETVQLFQKVDGVWTVVQTQETNANGEYHFEGLIADPNYYVRFLTNEDGKTFVEANVGGDDTVDSDGVQVVGTGIQVRVPLTEGENITNVDQGIEIVDAGNAQISGRITFDADDDDTEVAQKGGFDEGFGGKTVELLNEAGDVIATTTTAANGSYSFTGLDAGTYSVNFPDTMGLTIADKDVGAAAEDSDANANGQTDPITLAIGQNIPNVDLSLQDPADASLGGRIFHDSDNDDQDNGNGNEAPAAGVTVRLLDADGNELDTAVTDANGEYLFSNLKAGDYKVDFPLEVDGKVLVGQNVGNDLSDSDASQTTGETGVVSVGISQNVRDVDAGVEDPGTAAINGRLFMDNNDNSQDDAGDMGVAGVTVELLDDTGAVIDTTTTGANGEYSFNGLGAGDYSVSFPTEVDGKVLVDQNVGPDATDSDADQGTGETGTISLEIGDVSNNNDAGIEDPSGSAIEGVVFMDNNDNAQNDAGDMPVSGVPVELLNADGDVIGTTTTGADGSYSFTGLEAGTYSVNFPTEVDGKVLVNANVGNDASDSDADTATGNTGAITVGINETSSNNDAGIEDPGTARIGNLVFLDNDGNGRLSTGDERVEGVTVELLNEAGDVIETATTNANGFYFFDNLDAGIYSVKFTAPDGLEFTTQSAVAADAVNNDSDADLVTGETGQVELSIGETEWDLDAGLVVSDTGDAVISGLVFMDNNDNDIADTADMMIVGVPVQLLDADGNVVGNTTSGADGSYEFTGLPAGDYTVRFPTDVNGKTPVAANIGNNEAIDSDAVNGDVPVTVGIGETSSGNNAGFEDPGTAAIGDKVFLDTNGNGRQDAGEQGVAGVDVTVFNADGTVAGTDTTDANGDYLVGGLDAGTYTVGFEEVDGFNFTTANTSADGIDSDADEITGLTGPVTLEIGETDLTVDAGLVVENEAPVAGDDEGMVCATQAVSIDVLVNDTDADGDTLSVAHVNGQDIAVGGSVTLDSGAVVTLLANGELSYDSSTAVIGGVPADEIVQGETATDSFTYSITDGNGGTDTGEVSVTLKGDLDTIETILSSAPTSGTATFSGFTVGDAYTAVLDGTGDARYDGLTIADAYCLEYDADFLPGVNVTVDISGALDSLTNPGDFINDTSGNLDLINWLINQDFKSVDNGDGNATNYTDAEIQGAIWGIADNNPFIFELPGNGTAANVQELIDLATTNGEGFVAGEGDLFTLILNPTDVQAGVSEDDDFDQAFIIALPFDDFKEDCIC